MPVRTRTLPSSSAKSVVRQALIRAGALPDAHRVTPARVSRFAGPQRVLANVTSTLTDLVSDGDASVSGGEYRLTNQGLSAHRHAPSPRRKGAVT